MGDPIKHVVVLSIKDIDKIKKEIFEKFANGQYEFTNQPKDIGSETGNWKSFLSLAYSDAEECIYPVGTDNAEDEIAILYINPSDSFFVTVGSVFLHKLSFNLYLPNQSRSIEIYPGYTVEANYKIECSIVKVSRELFTNEERNSGWLKTISVLDHTDAGDKLSLRVVKQS